MNFFSKKIKLIIKVLILVILITTVGAVLIFADENPEIVSGTYIISAKEADTVRIGDKTFAPSSSSDLKNKFLIKVSGLESKFCQVLLNGVSLGYLSNGDNSFEFDILQLKDSENELLLLLTAGTATYNDSLVYGQYNLDDIVVESVKAQLGFLEPEAPSGMIRYLPVPGKSGTKPEKKDYSNSVTIGDGWNAETKLGGSTPNVPVSVAYLFNKPTAEGKVFAVDTKHLSDGKYEIEVLKNNTVIEKRTVVVDNTAPSFVISFKNGDVIANSNAIKFEAKDNLAITLTARLDSIPVTGNRCSLISLTEGNHNLYLCAVDALGNKAEEVFQFTVKKTIPDYTLYNKNGNAVLSIPEGASAKLYSVDLIGRINMYTNRLGEFSMKNLRSSNEVLAGFSHKGNTVTESVGNTLPYQSFVVEVGSNTGDAIVSYSGETGNGGDIILQGWNYKEQKWDTLARTNSGVSVNFKADIATYSKDGKMRVKASPFVNTNGSDTLLWVSDTQYYSRFDDLNKPYKDIMNYAKEGYISGNIGYVVHTGDIVDQTEAGSETAEKEYKKASEIQSILDKALVPNGIVAGNHDIVHTKADYSYFSKYFGADRYKNFEWFGGDFKDNTHHFDLITIGSYDFLFLYLGCFDEVSSDTVAWANSVLKAYPERNAVICTHEYLLPSGKYSGERAEQIWEQIVVPNKNVKMILCGHNFGAANQLRQVGDGDRFILEILADYQFAELGNEVQHTINNMTCDGEGFVRLLTFNEAGQVIATTYSPSADKYNYYPSYVDTFVYDLDLIPSVRSIKTTAFAVGVNPKEEGDFGKDKIDLSNADGVFAVISDKEINHTTEILVLKDKLENYPALGDNRKYETSFDRFSLFGMRGVAPSLRHEESNQKPSDKLVKSGLSLLPTEINTVDRTSGSNDFNVTYIENGKFKLNFTNESSNTWITTVCHFDKGIDVDEFDRLYFGVTTQSNAKWNLIVEFADGTSLNFSRGLYTYFGYGDYCIPSDIQGAWQGYIPLKDFVTGKATVTDVYFVSATSGVSVTFDYLFIGKSLGKEVLFVSESDISYSIDVLSGEQAQAILNPVRNGYVFDGWYSLPDGGERIEFPVKVRNNDIKAYARFTKKEAGNADGVNYFNDELEVLPGINYKKVVLILIVALTAVAGIFAATISTIRYRKKHRINVK